MSQARLSQKRLLWACRRGMLELDLLLLPFVEQIYPNLAEADQDRFERLLTEPDPQILAWLMGKEEPEHHDYQIIVACIRKQIPQLDRP